MLTVEVSLPPARAGTAERASAAWEQMAERLSALPGVTHVAATERVPLDGESGCSVLFVEGEPSSSPGDERPCVHTISVSPGYFAALQIPVRASVPTWADHRAASGGVVVSRALVQRFWPNEDPIGKGIRAHDAEPPYYRVIGVAENVHGAGLDSPPEETVYFPIIPLEGSPLWGVPDVMTLLVRTGSIDAESLVPAVRRVVQSVEPDAPVTRVRTMDAIVASATARITFITSIMVGAAAMALLLSLVGLYSVIAYVTRQRRTEIAIRMALGAEPRQILRSVIGQAVVLAMLGIFFGTLGTVAVTGAIRALMPDVAANEPVVLVAASLLILMAAALAGYLPARDAARLQPTEALR